MALVRKRGVVYVDLAPKSHRLTGAQREEGAAGGLPGPPPWALCPPQRPHSRTHSVLSGEKALAPVRCGRHEWRMKTFPIRGWGEAKAWTFQHFSLRKMARFPDFSLGQSSEFWKERQINPSLIGPIS